MKKSYSLIFVLLTFLIQMCSETSNIEDIKNQNLKSIVLENNIVLNNDQVARLNQVDALFEKYNFERTDMVTKEDVMRLLEVDLDLLEEELQKIVYTHKYSEEYTKIVESWIPFLEEAETYSEKMAIREKMEKELDSLKNVYY